MRADARRRCVKTELGWVLVDDHNLRRPVPSSRHIRLGQGDLGDRADRVLVYWDIRISDHTTARDGRTPESAGPAGSRRA